MNGRELEVRLIVGGGALVSGLAVASIWSSTANTVGWLIAFALTLLVAGRLVLELLDELRLRWQLRGSHLPATAAERAAWLAPPVPVEDKEAVQ